MQWSIRTILWGSAVVAAWLGGFCFQPTPRLVIEERLGDDPHATLHIRQGNAEWRVRLSCVLSGNGDAWVRVRDIGALESEQPMEPMLFHIRLAKPTRGFAQ